MDGILKSQVLLTAEFRPTPVVGSKPVTAKGKFFFVGEEKFFIKGVSYGPFCSGSHGAPFPERPIVEKDFALMAQLGANCIRIYTVPPDWLLELAAVYGLRVLIGIPWTQHVTFLDSSSVRAEIRNSIANGVKACRDYPAAFAYLVGNEIPSDIVRWHGPKRVRAFLKELMAVAKDSDPDALVSYANYPSTEYLELDFTDFLSFNVYLHREEDFRRYLSRLHNLAVDKPLVLSEFGADSIREGTEDQAKILSHKLSSSYEMGAAGTIVFSWTDEWFTGGSAIEDWAFGLVDRDRCLKPAFHTVQKHFTASVPPELPEHPKVSVIVCAYNADRTMDSCLASLKELHYPNYEVIVVNDGSTDQTLEIAQRYDYIHLINQENKGLSVARNVGLAAATGEIIAYTDSDCVAEPDWLTYLVAKFLSSDLKAVGGPNFPPPEDSLIPSCVAVSPGGPTHVLLNDEVAEHIPGCNMAFRREALEEIGGFDPLFRTAGDDVDVCWRLQDKGYTIGFSPAAVVWHFRRNTIKDYLKQQRGYGKAEALVYFKHPSRFNLLAQSKWLGRIYGDLSSSMLLGKPIIYSGVFGRGLFQTLYEPPASMLSYLPFTLEWNLVGAIFLVCVLLSGGNVLLAMAPFLLSWSLCAFGALRAKIDPRFRGPKARLLVALLIYLGPLVRSWERYCWRVKQLTKVEPVGFEEVIQKRRICWHEGAFTLSYWTDAALEKESLIQGLMDFLIPRKYFVAVDQGWSDWDLQIRQGLWPKLMLQVCTENHGGNKRLLRVKCRLRFSRLAALVLGALSLSAFAFASLGDFKMAVVMGALDVASAAAILYQNVCLGRTIYHALEILTKKLDLLSVKGTDTKLTAATSVIGEG
jgi:GT2 family glycosyltransferase